MDFSAQLIKNNIELLSFGYGVVFVLMGAALAGQRTVGKNIRIPVRLLAAFGLVHGFGEWLMTWSLVNGAFVPVTITRILAVAAAGVLLIEFSRRLALEAVDESRSPNDFGHVLGPGVHIVFAVLAVMFLAASGLSLAAAAQFAALGLLVPGMLACTAALAFTASRKSQVLRESSGLHYVALAAVSCGLLTLASAFAGFDWRHAFGFDAAAEATAATVLFSRLLVGVLFAIATVGLMGALRRFEQNRLILALERANKRNRGILDTAAEGIIELDPMGLILFANPAATGLLGYVTGEFEDTFFRAIFDHADDTDESGKNLLRAIRKGEAVAGDDLRFRRKDGRLVPVEYTCTPVCPDGRFLGTVITFSDISRRLRLTRLVKETQRIAQIGGWELDPASHKLRWTTETYRIHDLAPGTSVTVHEAVKYCRPRYREMLQRAIDRAVGKGTSFDLEVQLETGDERRVWARIQGKAYERDGERFRLSGTYQDVTDRKKSEKALRDSQEFYEMILDTVPIRIAYARKDESIAYVNHAYEQWFSQPRAKLVGRKIKDVVSAEAYAEVRPRIKKVLYGETVSFKVEAERGDELRWLEIHYLPNVSRRGEVKGFFSVTQDVTETEALEEKLLQAQKMEAMGQLTGGVAHDFNNLLGVIMGNLQLLERPLRDDQKLHRKVRTATRAAMRGADLTKRLLAFSRRQRLEPKVVDLNDLLGGLDELLRRSIGENVDIATDFCDGLWPTTIDPGQLENAMVNLAINARDAMDDGGELRISTRNEGVGRELASRHGGATPGEYVVVSVADNGSGIPEEYLERVFQPFFTTKEVGKGSGLGLSMVYGFVEQSGGFVAIDSTVGLGTDIQLYLPRAEEEIVEPREETAMHRFMPGGQETVLVVEDEEDVRETVLALLEELGYATIAAANGAEALRIVDNGQNIDLVLTDVMMPGGIDGPELARRIREQRPDMKIIFTSGFADGKVLERIDALPGSALIAKPYRNEELALRIRQTLDGNGENECQSQSVAGAR